MPQRVNRNTITVRVPMYYLELVDPLVADGYCPNREHVIVRAPRGLVQAAEDESETDRCEIATRPILWRKTASYTVPECPIPTKLPGGTDHFLHEIVSGPRTSR